MKEWAITGRILPSKRRAVLSPMLIRQDRYDIFKRPFFICINKGNLPHLE
jgi:hypothetical protein